MSYETLVTALSPVGYWPLQGDSTDHAGSNNGTDTDVTHSQSGPTINGESMVAADYNGTTSKTATALSCFSPSTQDLTYSCWVYADDFGLYSTLMSNSAAYGYASVWLQDTTGDPGLVQPYVNSVSLNDGTHIASGGWHHFAITFDQTNDRSTIYVDNVAGTPNSALSNWNASTGSLQWGLDPSTDALDGRMCQVVMFNKILSSEEIGSLYTGIPPSAPPSLGTVTRSGTRLG